MLLVTILVTCVLALSTSSNINIHRNVTTGSSSESAVKIPGCEDMYWIDHWTIGLHTGQFRFYCPSGIESNCRVDEIDADPETCQNSCTSKNFPPRKERCVYYFTDTKRKRCHLVIKKDSMKILKVCRRIDSTVEKVSDCYGDMQVHWYAAGMKVCEWRYASSLVCS